MSWQSNLTRWIVYGLLLSNVTMAFGILVVVEKKEKPETCQPYLVDGRRLMATHLNGDDQHARCVYEPVKVFVSFPKKVKNASRPEVNRDPRVATN